MMRRGRMPPCGVRDGAPGIAACRRLRVRSRADRRPSRGIDVVPAQPEAGPVFPYPEVSNNDRGSRGRHPRSRPPAGRRRPGRSSRARRRTARRARGRRRASRALSSILIRRCRPGSIGQNAARLTPGPAAAIPHLGAVVGEIARAARRGPTVEKSSTRMREGGCRGAALSRSEFFGNPRCPRVMFSGSLGAPAVCRSPSRGSYHRLPRSGASAVCTRSCAPAPATSSAALATRCESWVA